MVNLWRPEGEISRRELFKMAVPFGKVEIDNTCCTGCGLCTLDCPTGALAILQGEADAYRLVFKNSTCVACGSCVKVCPEKCLTMEHTLELERINQPVKVLFEDVIVRCSQCGSPVSSKAMLDKLRERLPDVSRRLPSGFELCPACKIKANFSRGNGLVDGNNVNRLRVQ